jgi:hypothetical protein
MCLQRSREYGQNLSASASLKEPFREWRRSEGMPWPHPTSRDRFSQQWQLRVPCFLIANKKQKKNEKEKKRWKGGRFFMIIEKH